MEREKMFEFVARALFEEIRLVRSELEECSLGDRRRGSLRKSLRSLSNTLAQVLSLAPDGMSEDELVKLIQNVPDVAPRRLRSRLERVVIHREAEVGA